MFQDTQYALNVLGQALVGVGNCLVSMDITDITHCTCNHVLGCQRPHHGKSELVLRVREVGGYWHPLTLHAHRHGVGARYHPDLCEVPRGCSPDEHRVVRTGSDLLLLLSGDHHLLPPPHSPQQERESGEGPAGALPLQASPPEEIS